MNYIWGSGLGKKPAGNAERTESDLTEETTYTQHTASPTQSYSSPAPAASYPGGGYDFTPTFTPPTSFPSSVGFQSPYLNMGQIDPSVLSAPKKQGQSDYVFESQSTKRRPFYEQMPTGIAASYMSGQAIGGSWGLLEGLRNPVATSTRLKINSVLNAVTKRGPSLGNAAGSIACMFGFINYGLIEARGGHDDDINGLVSAVSAGALFKCTAGVRAVAVASTTAGALYVLYAVGRTLLSGGKISSPKDILQEKVYE